MTTLRPILKYTPAVVLGLLVAGWVVSIPFAFGFVVRGSGPGFDTGSVGVAISTGYSGVAMTRRSTARGNWLGKASFRALDGGYYLTIPIPILLTLLFPVTIGPFLSFRFRLWHYLAFTALIAIELAYYLRWQE